MKLRRGYGRMRLVMNFYFSSLDGTYMENFSPNSVASISNMAPRRKVSRTSHLSNLNFVENIHIVILVMFKTVHYSGLHVWSEIITRAKSDWVSEDHGVYDVYDCYRNYYMIWLHMIFSD